MFNIYCIKCCVNTLAEINKSGLKTEQIEELIFKSEYIDHTEQIELIGDICKKVLNDNEDYEGYYKFRTTYMEYYICSCIFEPEVTEMESLLMEQGCGSAYEGIKWKIIGMRIDENKCYLNNIKLRYSGGI